MEFYRKQVRIALRNCGLIDPEDITEYIARDGYAPLPWSWPWTRPRMPSACKASGSGDAGAAASDRAKMEDRGVQRRRYEVCVLQCRRVRPGRVHGRSILEGDPHSIIEAMAICGYCIGA